MNNYDISFKALIKHEGGYANDPIDRGGETYRGISRKWHPDWNGWEVIDAKKKERNFPQNLDNDDKLQERIKRFYKVNYWDSFSGDSIDDVEIAFEIFEFGVHVGVRRSVERLQRSLNILSRNESLYSTLVVDGIVGQKTLAALNIILSNPTDNRILLTLLNVFQGMHYIQIIESNESQQRYARGWFNRVEIVKSQSLLDCFDSDEDKKEETNYIKLVFKMIYDYLKSLKK